MVVALLRVTEHSATPAAFGGRLVDFGEPFELKRSVMSGRNISLQASGSEIYSPKVKRLNSTGHACDAFCVRCGHKS